jgi:chromosomal replication initiator protein
VSTELEKIWSRVQRKLEAAVDGATYRVWLEPLRLQALAGEELTVEAPAHAGDWIHQRFRRLLRVCASAALGHDVIVTVVHATPSRPTEHRPNGARRGRQPTHGAREPDRPAALDGTRYAAPPQGCPPNPNLTFDRFVIGDSNRLAHAAALTVAELPGQAYNPLFICGAPGVGKTHLLHSIANLIAACNPNLSVRTTTGEAFTTEFQAALAGGGGTGDFKTRYRGLDVMLIDDVQFLERKARTEEEFFHTFNALHEGGAQIVLTSDRPPHDLQALEDRLRERFEAGLVTDIGAPDLNTRLAILRKRAQHDALKLPDDDVLRLIARRITLNVRALEGALIRVVAYSSLTGRAPTVELATEVLDGLYPHTRLAPHSIDAIKTATCAHFDLSSAELTSSSRSPRVTWPRQVAMYLARELTDDSLPMIGRSFGGRDHTTVMYAIRRTEARITADASSRHAVDTLRRRLEHRRC